MASVVDSESLFRLAAEALPTGIVLVAPDGAMVVINARVERQFGYPRDEILGRSFELLVPSALRGTGAASDPGSEKPAEAPAASGARRARGRRRDGSEFPVEITLNPVATDQGDFVLASIVEITVPSASELAAQEAVDKQLEVERLVAELSYSFINLPSDQVVSAINDALSRIGRVLEVDRCSFWRLQPSGVPVVPMTWADDGVVPSPPLKSRDEFPWVFERLAQGHIVCFARVGEVPDAADQAGYRGRGIQSAVTVPISVNRRVVGAVGFNMLRRERVWSPQTLQSISVIAAVFGNLLARCESDEALQHEISRVERVRDQLQAENLYLRRAVEDRLGNGLLVGQSPAFRRALDQLQHVARTDSTVLLLGETGTGKELFATRLHELSARARRFMVRVNCSAIPTTLIESELFGREKGAFTGALARQAGRFELADHSTIFLDEIGELPMEVQVKLLRVLEERQIERLGSPTPIGVDVRIVAATHRNLGQRIADGTFREDLFYRLNVFPINVPPLRDRAEDIPLLVWRFVAEFSTTFSKRIDAIPQENMARLQRYPWPGNIRELRNVVERAMIMAGGPRLTIPVPSAAAEASKRSSRLDDVERDHIVQVLNSVGWRIRGAGGASEQLGLKPTTLETRMSKLGIARPKRP